MNQFDILYRQTIRETVYYLLINIAPDTLILASGTPSSDLILLDVEFSIPTNWDWV